jgi:heme/copper-type cytochrome/quinol oxidase subunit 2
MSGHNTLMRIDMDSVWNIAMIFFMLSGFVAWAVAILLSWYYWLCQPKKEQ